MNNKSKSSLQPRLIRHEVRNGEVVFHTLTPVLIAQLMIEDQNIHVVRDWQPGTEVRIEAATVVANPDADQSGWSFKPGLLWLLHVNL